MKDELLPGKNGSKYLLVLASRCDFKLRRESRELFKHSVQLCFKF